MELAAWAWTQPFSARLRGGVVAAAGLALIAAFQRHVRDLLDAGTDTAIGRAAVRAVAGLLDWPGYRRECHHGKDQSAESACQNQFLHAHPHCQLSGSAHQVSGRNPVQSP